jgi:hypothetical protein
MNPNKDIPLGVWVSTEHLLPASTVNVWVNTLGDALPRVAWFDIDSQSWWSSPDGKPVKDVTSWLDVNYPLKPFMDARISEVFIQAYNAGVQAALETTEKEGFIEPEIVETIVNLLRGN